MTQATTGTINIKCTQLPHGADLPLPAYETSGAAGMDLMAAIPAGEDIVLEPGERRLVPTGLSIAVPPGFEAQIRPRSGLALRHGITMVNAPGTIDSDYRGEVGVILINLGQEPFTIRRAERIGQMVIAAYVQADWQVAVSLDETQRGSGGFGSTGTKVSSGGAD